MNELIERLFDGFTVDGERIPVSFLYYDGHSETYITYMNTDADDSYSADDRIQNYVEYYDFDFYSKGDYTNIISQAKQVLEDGGFTFQPSRTSPDMYETDTGYYHKTLCFAIERSN